MISAEAVMSRVGNSSSSEPAPYGDNLGEQFVSAARAYPDRPFLRWCCGDDIVTWTYRDAAQRIAGLVARLDDAGVHHGDRVVIFTDEMVPSILFDVACACAGAPFTPIETTSIPAVVELCRVTDAKAVLTTPARVNAFDGLATLATITCDPRAGADALTTSDALALLSDRAARVEPATIYMLQPTSGTTGESKLVVRNHATFVRVGRLWSFGESRDTQPHRRTLMVPALTHGMGQYLLASALWMAAELDVTSAIDVRASIDEIRRLDPTFITLTPRVVQSLVRQLGGVTDGMFGPGLRRFVSSGAPPDKDALLALQRCGVTVIEAFGSSECSIVAMTRPGQWRADILGHVVDDVDVRVAPDGELHVRSAYAMVGYHGQPERSQPASADGFFHTGDRVAIGPDGEFVYLGRLVESFNLFDGSHVAPHELEDRLARLAWVDQVVLLGDQRPYIVALIVPHPRLRSDRSDSFRRMIELDVARVCSSQPTSARVRRIALVDQPFPDDVFRFVAHGKIRRGRAAAARLYAPLVSALYESAEPSAHEAIVQIPGSSREQRASTRHVVAWLVRVGDRVMTTADVSRTGVLIERDQRLVGRVRVELLDLDVVIDSDVVRHDERGTALRWVGPASALAVLKDRLSA
jgi:long-chain acyl-CoA synthetase